MYVSPTSTYGEDVEVVFLPAIAVIDPGAPMSQNGQAVAAHPTELLMPKIAAHMLLVLMASTAAQAASPATQPTTRPVALSPGDRWIQASASYQRRGRRGRHVKNQVLFLFD